MRDLVVRNLGTVLLRTMGEGYLSDKSATIACEVIVELDPDIEINEDCQTVDFAHSYFWVHFKSGWDCSVDGHPYNDKTFEKAVQDFLVSQGFPGNVGWSEMGRQESTHADFDCDYDVLEALFPETFAAARATKLAERPAPVDGGVIEYSITKAKHVIRVVARDGTIVDTHEHENLAPPYSVLPYRGSHSMTSIAMEQVARMAAWYQIPRTKKVKAA